MRQKQRVVVQTRHAAMSLSKRWRMSVLPLIAARSRGISTPLPLTFGQAALLRDPITHQPVQHGQRHFAVG